MGVTVLEGTVDMDMEVMTVMDLEGMMILMAMMKIMKMVTIAVIILYHSHVPYRKVQAISVHPKTFMEIPSKLRSRSLDGSMMITLENVSHLFIQVVVEMITDLTAKLIAILYVSRRAVRKSLRKAKKGKRFSPYHLKRKQIERYLATSYLLGRQRLSVQANYLNTPLEYQYLNQYHGVKHPLTYTPIAQQYGLSNVAPQTAGYTQMPNGPVSYQTPAPAATYTSASS